MTSIIAPKIFAFLFDFPAVSFIAAMPDLNPRIRKDIYGILNPGLPHARSDEYRYWQNSHRTS